MRDAIAKELSTAPLRPNSRFVRLKEAIAQKRPAFVNRRGIVFYQDIARPRTSIVLKNQKRKDSSLHYSRLHFLFLTGRIKFEYFFFLQ